ncbi:MAG: transporter related-protein [Verrucomicrobiales bacterium]|nr:transporter related-protein [Verrucomicrobiales bacterium]
MIEAREVHKSFGSQKVLNGVSLKIETGERVVIIGRSGGGKSILLKHLIGLLQPDAGEVLVNGQRIDNQNEHRLLEVRRKFGMLFQGAALFDSLTVHENVAFALHRQGKWTDQEIRAKVTEALEMVDLPGIEDKKPAELSGGMRKRVGLARAIVYKPEIILYDEPTTGLDPISADSIDKMIVKISDRLNVTSIAVTHDMRSAGIIAQRILMLHQGKIYATGTPAEILKSTDPIVHRFVNGISDPKEHNL